MIITLQVSISPFVTIPYKTSIAKSGDGFKVVTHFLEGCEMAKIQYDYLAERLPMAGEQTGLQLLEDLWSTVVTCVDMTFKRGRKVDVEQVLAATYAAHQVEPVFTDALDKLTHETLISLTTLYCEGATARIFGGYHE